MLTTKELAIIVHKTSNKVWNSEVFNSVSEAAATASAKIPSKNQKNYRVRTLAQMFDLLDSYQATNSGMDSELDETADI